MVVNKTGSNHNFRQIIAYGIGGVGTTVFNILLFQLLLFLKVDYKISNLIAIISTKILAYLVNKIFVFQSKCESFAELVTEMFRYILARGATGLVDYFGLILAVDVLNLHATLSKCVLQVIVIVSNYILGKKTVFVGNKNKKDKTVQNSMQPDR